ncbi:MAG: amidohydrolase [Solobacterium sp.]|nr:amidohydrolase [Solobacterium sp.]
MIDLIRECEDLYEEIVSIRRELHAHPDLGMACENTVQRITDYLNREEIPYTITNHGGVVAEIEGTKGSSDKVILMRSDMDALPLVEETGLPFSPAEPGRMHACGHDLHTAIMLGAASLLKRHCDEFAGKVHLLFQPGEETSEGARAMIEDGVMENISMVYGLHMDPNAPTGILRVKPGPDWAAVDRFTIRVHGKSSHGAMPHKGADAIVAASAVVQAIQTIVSRACDPIVPPLITVGSFHSGTTWNIISDLAVLEGTCRSFDSEVYKEIPSLLERVAVEIPKSYGCTGELEMIRKAPPVINDPKVYEIVCSSARKVIGEDRIQMAKQEMIGEDFALFENYAPVCFVHLGGGADYPLHSSHVIFQEESMKTGMALEVQFAIDALAYLNGE